MLLSHHLEDYHEWSGCASSLQTLYLKSATHTQLPNSIQQKALENYHREIWKAIKSFCILKTDFLDEVTGGASWCPINAIHPSPFQSPHTTPKLKQSQGMMPKHLTQRIFQRFLRADNAFS